jgi:hypothetical protein
MPIQFEEFGLAILPQVMARLPLYAATFWPAIHGPAAVAVDVVVLVAPGVSDGVAVLLAVGALVEVTVARGVAEAVDVGLGELVLEGTGDDVADEVALAVEVGTEVAVFEGGVDVAAAVADGVAVCADTVEGSPSTTSPISRHAASNRDCRIRGQVN